MYQLNMRKQRKGLNIFNTDVSTNLILYKTIIIACNGEFIILNTGGWRSNHTKKCMNENLPTGFRVFQKDFRWYVETPVGVFDFEDEMILDLRGNLKAIGLNKIED